MTVEDKPDVTYDEVGGAKDALEKLREVVELPLLHPERFVSLGIDPPKGVLLYGPPGTGKVSFGRMEGGREEGRSLYTGTSLLTTTSFLPPSRFRPCLPAQSLMGQTLALFVRSARS